MVGPEIVVGNVQCQFWCCTAQSFAHSSSLYRKNAYFDDRNEQLVPFLLFQFISKNSINVISKLILFLENTLFIKKQIRKKLFNFVFNSIPQIVQKLNTISIYPNFAGKFNFSFQKITNWLDTDLISLRSRDKLTIPKNVSYLLNQKCRLCIQESHSNSWKHFVKSSDCI